MGFLYECVNDITLVIKSANIFQGNVDLQMDKNPSMRLTDGQAVTRCDDSDRKSSAVHQGPQDYGIQETDPIG